MELYFYTSRLDVAATSLADLTSLISALADESDPTNAATIDKVVGKIQPLVQSDTGEPLTLKFYDDATTPASWAADSGVALAIGLGYQDANQSYVFTSTATTAIVSTYRTATLALNTARLQSELSKWLGMSGSNSRYRPRFYLHLRKTDEDNYAETVALLPIQVLPGVLSNPVVDDQPTQYITNAELTAALAALRLPVKPEDYGAVGDGVTDDTDAMNSALAASREVALANGKSYLVTSLTNTFGSQFTGPGKVLTAVTGGTRQLNSYGDRDKYIFGREYLSYFHKRLIANLATATGSVIQFTGDSTTAGDSTTTPYRIWELVPAAAKSLGLRGVTGTNRGQSGKAAYEWVSTYLAGDLAASPNVMVIRWGANDFGLGQTVAQTLTSMRSALTTIRASRDVTALSLVLCTPNVFSDTPNARDEKNWEQYSLGLQQLAREFQCVFVDVYAYLRDARTSGAGDWMDNPYSDGRRIHPLNVMNAWISTLLCDALFPQGLVAQIAQNKIANVSGVFETRTTTSAFTTYEQGVSMYRATGGSPAWPYDGCVITHRFVDDTAIQWNYTYMTGDTRYAYRYYRSGAWSSFYYVGEFTANATAAAGFSAPASDRMRGVLNGTIVVGEGYVTKTSPGTIAAGTTVATMPASFRPVNYGVWGVSLAVWDGTNWEFPRAKIETDGDVVLQQAVTLTATRVCFGPAVWTVN